VPGGANTAWSGLRIAGPGNLTGAAFPLSKENSMSQSNIIGLVVLALGGVLLFFAWRASNAPVEQLSEALTGRYTDNTMWYMIGGVVAVVAGIALLVRGGARR
jgi:uncharacterized membrane protein HdeD (DUF308 family)